MFGYDELGRKILNEGTWVENDRTGVKCLTLINADLEYHPRLGLAPLMTSRHHYIKGAVSEFIGYLRGYSNAAQFRAIGSNTWNSNANETKAWLANPNRKGEDDMGRVYGVQLRDWTNQFGEKFDQLAKVVNNLKNGIDDRGEIVTFWNPGEFAYGCLRPCMHTHQFSLLDGVLYLHSTSRSVDWALGLPANMVQAYIFLQLMARITGHQPGTVYHKMVNVHIYENQHALAIEQLARPKWEGEHASIAINKRIQTLDDVLTKLSVDDVTVENYSSHPGIKYPFTS